MERLYSTRRKHHTSLCIVFILIGIAFYAWYGYYKVLFVNLQDMGEDFKMGYEAAQRFLSPVHQTYDNPPGSDPFFYPPLSLFLFLPFLALDLQTAMYVWFVVSHLVVLTAAWLVYRIGHRIDPLTSAAAASLAFFCSLQFYSSVAMGNVNNFILLALAVVFWSLLSTKKSMTIPAIAIVLSTYLKIYPSLLMAAFLRNRFFKAIGSYLVVMAVITLISVITFGIEEHVFFFKNLTKGFSLIGPLHAMSIVYILKLLPGEDPVWFCFIVDGIVAAALFLIWWIRAEKSRAPQADKSTLVTDMIVIIVIGVMIFPASWMYYHILFTIPFYLIIFSYLREGPHFRYFGLFAFLFIGINLWEIIAFHLPVTDYLAIYEIGKQHQDEYPVLYRVTYALPFVFNLLFYFWLLVNYENVRNAIKYFRR